MHFCSWESAGFILQPLSSRVDLILVDSQCLARLETYGCSKYDHGKKGGKCGGFPFLYFVYMKESTFVDARVHGAVCEESLNRN